MVVEASAGNVDIAQVLPQVSAALVSHYCGMGELSDLLEFLVLVNKLNAMLEVGMSILALRCKVAIQRHVVWRRRRSYIHRWSVRGYGQFSGRSRGTRR